MSKTPIAVQLYSVREACAADLEGTIKEIAGMGYDGVEFAGYYDRSAAELREMLDGNGLRVAGTHIGINTLLGDELEKTVTFNRELGNRYLIVPGLPEEYRDSCDAWRRTADVFTGIAAALTAHDMFTGYHNHFTEFAPMDGSIPLDVLCSNTPDTVVLQADIGNAMHGGADVLDFVERYPGRARTVHLKEFSAENDQALIGEGDADWDRVFGLCETQGVTDWYIVEQETYAHPPLECVRRCLDNLRGMGRA